MITIVDQKLISRTQMVMRWSDVLSDFPLYSHPGSGNLARLDRTCTSEFLQMCKKDGRSVAIGCC